MSIRVIADDKIPFLEGALEPFVDIEYVAGSSINRDMLTHTDALLIRTRTHCNSELLDGTAVKFIASATIGYDHIDTEYCEAKGIFWTNAPGCNSGSVQQYFASALLSYAREKQVDLTKRVLGIVGVGNVGTKVLKVAEQLSMNILLNDPPRAQSEGTCGYTSLDGIVRDADIITFHVPLNKTGPNKTFHLADTAFFERLNSNTLLINTSRGEVVDTKAVNKALTSGQLGDAILDVWENEPNIDSELCNQTFISTPHIAGYSADGKAMGTQMSVRALSKFFELGIDDWEPESVPEPENITITIDAANKSFQEILTELVLQTYIIKNEDKWLRGDISRFEYYRGSYPLRREFGAYKIKPVNMDELSKRKLRKLGFKLLD